MLLIFQVIERVFGGNTQYYLLGAMLIVYIGISVWYSTLKQALSDKLPEGISDEELEQEYGEELGEELSQNPETQREIRSRKLFDLFVGIPTIIAPNIIYYTVNKISLSLDSNFNIKNMGLLLLGFGIYLLARKLFIGNFKD